MMKIIDVHVHYNPQSEFLASLDVVKDYSFSGLLKEMEENSVEKSVIIGGLKSDCCCIIGKESPGVAYLEQEHPSLLYIAGINPAKLTTDSLIHAEQLLEQKRLSGFKIYLGYLEQMASDVCYAPVYDLAQRYHVPVMFHTGFVASRDHRAYGTGNEAVENVAPESSHPDSLRDIFDTYPDLKMILAHFGCPNFTAAATLINDYDRVWSDISAFEVGTNAVLKEGDRVRATDAFHLVKDKSKILYGSDWPLVPMKDYIAIAKQVIPLEFHEQVFYENAKQLFRL